MNYFLAPRSGEKSYKNFLSTIKNGVPFDRIAPFLTEEGIIKVAQEDIIYAWGNREGTRSQWEKMEDGDTVIFYSHGKLVSSGVVYYKQHSPDLALAMWPRDENGNPWEFTFFIKDLKYFSIPMPVFNKLVDFKSNYIIQGFRELPQSRLDILARQYGNVETFLNDFKDEDSAEIPLSNEPVYVNLESQIQPEIISNPSILMPEKYTKSTNGSKAPYKVDHVARSRNNAITGSKGEVLTFIQEKRRLTSMGRDDLARKVERVSLIDDKLGFDVLSFEENGKERFIEVKTTTANTKRIRFYLSANEYNASSKLDNYNLYFVDRISKPKPRITIFNNPFRGSQFQLTPETFVVDGYRT